MEERWLTVPMHALHVNDIDSQQKSFSDISHLAWIAHTFFRRNDCGKGVRFVLDSFENKYQHFVYMGFDHYRHVESSQEFCY